MIYLLCAFESEARAVIEAYKLSKKESEPFKRFASEEMMVLISGLGQDRAKDALEYLLLHYPNKPQDVFINLGICAGQKTFPLGKLVQVNLLQNEEESHRLSPSLESTIPSVSCFSSLIPLERPTTTDIAEMEALAIYTFVNAYFPLKQISFLKIVSDHFNPIKLSKAFVIELTYKNITAIKAHIQNLKELSHANN